MQKIEQGCLLVSMRVEVFGPFKGDHKGQNQQITKVLLFHERHPKGGFYVADVLNRSKLE